MFGQIVIGPPGSGKSTYCAGLQQFYNAIGRQSAVINLDPANDRLNYECELDIRDVVRLEDVMAQEELGPNGGLMYALETLDASVDMLVDRIGRIRDSYLIFDCPGQTELFTHHSALQRIFRALEKQLGARLCVVALVDSFYLTSPSQYVSVVLLALRSMLQLDLPHINVLSKIDLLSNYGELPFRLDYYTQAEQLDCLQPYIERESSSVMGRKYARLTSLVAELVEDFGLVQFEVLCVEDKQSMISLVAKIDKANGYLFGATEIGGDSVWAEATRQGSAPDIDIQDRWIDNKKLYDDEIAKQAQQEHKDHQDQLQQRQQTEEEELQDALLRWEKSENL